MKFLALCMAAVVAGCGSGVVCGPDTRVQDGKCVPATLVRCGEGTKLDGGACVPAEPLSCGPGTVASEGRCIPASSLSCGAGTEEKAGVCVALDPMKRVTVPEASEPNIPTGKSARFTVPAIGASPVVLGGTIDVPLQGTPDFDGFIFHASRLQRLRVTARAVGVPSVGFVLQPCKSTGTDVCDIDVDRNFSRFAITLQDRGAARDLVLPTDGDWLFMVSDESNLTQGLPFGGSAFTYTIDVVQVAQPEPAPLTTQAAVSGTFESLAGHALEVDAESPLYDVTLAPQSDAAPFPGQRALWAVGPDGNLLFSEEDDTTYGVLTPIKPVRAAFPPGKSLVMPDFVYALGTAPPYTLSVTRVETVAMHDLAQPFEARGSLAGDGVDVYSVDVPPSSLLAVEMVPRSGTQIVPEIELRDAQYHLVGTAASFSIFRFFGATEGGRYYLVARDSTFDASKISLGYTMKASLTNVEPLGPVGVGQPESRPAQVLDANGVAWFAVIAGNDADVALVVHPAADLDVAAASYPALASVPIATADAGGDGADETLGNKLLSSGTVMLVKVSGAAGGTFDITATATDTGALFETEPNDDPAKANALTFDANGHAEGAGTLKNSADRDCYSFRLTQSSTVKVQTLVGARGGTANTEMYLLTSTGSYVSWNDDAPGSKLSRIETTLGAGTYVVRVEPSWHATDTDAPDYVVSVDAH